MSVKRENILDQTEFASLLKEAEVCYEQGLYTDAKKIYINLLKNLEEMPVTPEVEAQKKLLEEKIENIENNIKEQDNVVPFPILESENPSEIYQKAIVLKDIKLFKEAVEEFKKALNADYKIEDCISNIVYCYEKQGLKPSVIKFLEQILTTKDTLSFEKKDEIKYKLSRLYEEINIYGKALSYLEQIKNKARFPNLKQKIQFLSTKVKSGTKFDYLLQKGIIKKQDLEKARTEAEKENKSIEFILLQEYRVPKKDLAESLSLFFDCPFVFFDPNIPIPSDLIKDLKYQYLKYNHWVPLKRENNRIIVAIDNPHDLSRVDIIKKLLQTSNIELVVSTKEDIENFVDYFWGQQRGTSIQDLVADVEEEAITEEELVSETEDVDETDSRVVQFVNQMILDAWRKKASDIHIEPSPSNKITQVRFRIDGVCQPYIQIPNSFTRLCNLYRVFCCPDFSIRCIYVI